MSQFHLLRDRRFWPLFWTQFLGAFNDNFFKNALVMLITFHAREVAGIPASQMVPLAGGVFILPFFLFSATAGQLADAFEKAMLIRWIKAVEIGIMVLAAIGFGTHHFGFLLGVLFLMGLHSTFFGPLKYSILPEHLSPGELAQANAWIEAGTFLAILLGTLLGGVWVSRPGGSSEVSLVLFLVALGGWWTSRRIPPAPAPSPGLRVEWNPISPTIAMVRMIFEMPSLLRTLLGISWFWFFGATLLSLIPTYVNEVLGQGEAVVTLFLALFSIGIGVGSLFCGRLSRRVSCRALIQVGTLGVSIFSWVLFLSGGHPYLEYRSIIAGSLFLISLSSGLFIVPLYTRMQEDAPPSHRSRVIAANNVLNALFMVISAGVTLMLLRLGLTIPGIFGLLGLLNLGMGLALGLPVARLRSV